MGCGEDEGGEIKIKSPPPRGVGAGALIIDKD